MLFSCAAITLDSALSAGVANDAPLDPPRSIAGGTRPARRIGGTLSRRHCKAA
jgi:hypothetical protein